jgi:SMC interacting uncharacterized protein involved in chromosome segregation
MDYYNTDPHSASQKGMLSHSKPYLLELIERLQEEINDKDQRIKDLEEHNEALERELNEYDSLYGAGAE